MPGPARPMSPWSWRRRRSACSAPSRLQLGKKGWEEVGQKWGDRSGGTEMGAGRCEGGGIRSRRAEAARFSQAWEEWFCSDAYTAQPAASS